MVPYLDNPSDEAISESSHTKEQRETIKLLNDEVRMLQQKYLKALITEQTSA